MFALLFIIIAPGVLSVLMQSTINTNQCIGISNSAPQDVFGARYSLVSQTGTVIGREWIFEQHPNLDEYYKIIMNETQFCMTLATDLYLLPEKLMILPANRGGDADEKYWRFLFDNENLPGKFKIVNKVDDHSFVSLTSIKQIKPSDSRLYLVGVAIENEQDNREYMNFIEDYEIINVEYNLNQGEIISDIPFVAGHGICNNANGGSSHQEIKVIVSETRTETSSFQRSSGYTISVGSTFSAGIPSVGIGGDISTDISQTQEFVFGKEKSIERTFTTELPVRCDPGEIIEVECIIHTAVIDVPYTMTVLGLESGIQFKSIGIFKGTQSYSFICEFTHINADDNVILFREQMIIN